MTNIQPSEHTGGYFNFLTFSSYGGCKTPPTVVNKLIERIRRILLPNFLTKEIQQYLSGLKDIVEDKRMFPFTKSYLHYEMRRGCAASGVKKIKIHGIRHSHISLLIDMGCNVVAIADRLGMKV